jgi:beta-galactosidase
MIRQMYLFIVCAFLLFGSAGGGFSQDAGELEIDHALTLEFSTPHTEWAKPYAHGNVRVLFFSDGRGTNARECVELMQRFDIEAKAVFWANINDSNKESWHGGEMGERRMLKLLQQKWDCFVFLGLPMTNVPLLQKQIIVDSVTNGAGIVFVGSNDGNVLTGKKRIMPPLMFVDPEDGNSAYAVGQGRGIYLPNRPTIDYDEGWETHYDYWQERLGRALLWASGKEPTMRLDLTLSPQSHAGSGEATVRSEDATSLLARLSGDPSSRGLKIQVQLRSAGHAPVRLPEKDISAGDTVEFPLPRLPKGTWHVDARVTGTAGIEIWATCPFEVHTDRSVSAVMLDQNWGELGDVISGTVVVSGSPSPREIMRVQLLDRRRRELVRKNFPVMDRSLKFDFPVLEWLPMLVTVEARLYSNGIEIDRAYKYFHVTKRKQGRFNFLMWGAPKGTLAPYAEESLAQNGVTLQLDWENPPLSVGAYDISWVPFTTHIPVGKTSSGIMKPFCWNDGRAVKRQIDMLVSGHRGSREHGTFVYSVGDENTTLGSCLSSACADTYRVFLHESYGSLDELNRSWQTQFTDWKDVGLSSTADDDELASRNSKNYSRWFDRQAYKSWNYVQYCLKHAKAYKTLDPKAKTGFDGAGGFAAGDDLDLIVRSMDSWVPYQGLHDEVIRSIAPRDFVRSNWIGGRDKTAGPLLQKYWRLVTLGADSIWWWMWSCIGQLHGFLAPDLRSFPEIKEVVKDTQIVRDGLGDLLLYSTMQDDGIAILYSYPSVFAHKLDEGSSFGGYEEAHSALITLIRKSGFQFRYVTNRMLRQGEFDLSKYRILFLPRAEAIGDKEAQAIKRFVENGGTVVADVRPGLYDDHCKVRSGGVLDDLFGIKRAAKLPAKSVRLPAGKQDRKIAADAGIMLNGAHAGRVIEGIPLWLTRSKGKGRAILLNSDMAGLPGFISAGLLKGNFWGCEPTLKIARLDGTKPQDLEITRWRDEQIEIVSLLRKGKGAEEVAISMHETKYIYDLRFRKTYGPSKRFTATILPDRASFFVLMDKPAGVPRLQLKSPSVRPGTIVKADLSVPGAQGMHAVKIGVESGGRPQDWHERTLLVGITPIHVEIPIAYNDPKGDYRVTFTDLFSNEKRALSFTVHKD